ncbi:RNA polymerase sigma factor SigF [Microcoleus sp. FACHB-1515]|uniref:RNA polymerase sigma factor SigF n=1 Tax=Cyanophyceae TaxID=3028117 RepID=UPI001683F338|nr:RNA polymerase sigma factor SigF [Microcoleus sp. FACHB-1515]MBD2088393.1 RNA polymerase sigma factor SigF [Microcoleus sp. FACHB-1515]
MTAPHSLRSHALDLLIEYQQNPSIQLRNRLVSLNAGLVRKLAHRLSHQCAEPYEDLEQIGYLGLIRAIERFDPAQGCAFSSFAVPYIRGEILHYLRDRSSAVKLPRRWQELHKASEKARGELVKTLGRPPQDAEIAAAINLSPQEWSQLKIAMKNRSPLSLDATVSQSIDSTVTLGEILPDTHHQALQRLEEDSQQLHRALSQLEDKTRAAIEFVFFSGLTRKETAARIGVSPMTVTRRIQRGLDQMMAMLQPQSVQTDP